MAAQPGELLPRLSAVGRAEQGGVFNAGVDRVRIGQRRFEMPDALELPGMRRAVVPLVRAGNAVVHELVAHRLPGLAAVVGALDHLPEPAAGLRRIQPIRVGGRSLEVVDLPAAKMGPADVPLFALSVRRQDERALACPRSHPHATHRVLLPRLVLSICLVDPRRSAHMRRSPAVCVTVSSGSRAPFHPVSTRAEEFPLYCRSGRPEIDRPRNKMSVGRTARIEHPAGDGWGGTPKIR